MLITRQSVANQLATCLRHKLTLAQVVDGAEHALLDGEFEPRGARTQAAVVARLGVADVRAFGLTWEDCEQLLRQVGVAARVELVPA